MRIRVILNPAAGGGTGADRVRRALERLPGADLRVSAGPADVRRLAGAASREGIGRIVAAGGDGTVSELASGLVEAGHQGDAGILPVGTGNDLARALGIPLRLEAAAGLLARGRSYPVDAVELDPEPAVGRAVSRRAWNSVVGGFCGRIGERLPPARRRRWGAHSYLRAAVDELRDLRPHPAALDLDGERVELDLLMLIVANGRYAGGRLPLAPRADPADGRIDVVAIRAMSVSRLLALVPAVLAGRHPDAPEVLVRRVHRARLEVGAGFWMNADGETWAEGSAGFRVRPGALPFVRPAPARPLAPPGNPPGAGGCPSR